MVKKKKKTAKTVTKITWWVNSVFCSESFEQHDCYGQNIKMSKTSLFPNTLNLIYI